jgi:quinoprotein glucose dehydrogenase
LKSENNTIGIFDFDDLPDAQASGIQSSNGHTRPANATASADRMSFPAEFIIPAAKAEMLSKSNGWPSSGSGPDWERSLGGSTSNRFSELTQITPANVAMLDQAWTYHSGDGGGNIQCNAIVVGGVIFTPTPGKNIVAIDGATGKERWRFAMKELLGAQSSAPARRGLLFWKGDAKASPRLLFGDGNWLVALDSGSGKPVPGFGEGGKVAVPTGTTVAGAMHGHILVLPGYGGDVYGFDARDGRRMWTFKTRPESGSFGFDTWSQVESGANCWGGMALDESRGIAYVSVGSLA